MNRIKISPLATAAETTTSEKPQFESLGQLEKLTCKSNDEWSVFVPMHYEKNYSYPLIVWLHSEGDDRAELQRIMPQTSLRNFVGVATDGPVGDPHRGFHWDQHPDSVAVASDSVLSAIDYVTMRYNIATDRVFLAGFGAAGTMAYRLAFQRPDLFAGIISINGPLPEGRRPLREWNRSRDLPVLWAHFRDSSEFSEGDLCRQLRLLHIAGFSVTLRQYPGDDHLSPSSLSDMNDWIMEQIDSAVL